MKLGGVPRKKLERAADLAVAGHSAGVIASRTLLTLSVCREIHAAYLRASQRDDWPGAKIHPHALAPIRSCRP